MSGSDDYNCLKCGACCVSDVDGPSYVHLKPSDVDRIDPEDRDRLLVDTGPSLTAMRTLVDKRGNCRCIALKGAVGSCVSCSIYDDRPTACRNFQPGTEECDYARQMILGIGPG